MNHQIAAAIAALAFDLHQSDASLGEDASVSFSATMVRVTVSLCPAGPEEHAVAALDMLPLNLGFGQPGLWLDRMVERPGDGTMVITYPL